jgi:hypothetical protein
MALSIEQPTAFSLIFGCSGASLTRVLLAAFTEQRLAVLLAGYAVVLPLALVLSRLATRRMKDRTPRIVTAAMSIATTGLYALPGVVPTINPAVASNRAALGAMVILALATAVKELLHRAADEVPVTPAPRAARARAAGKRPPSARGAKAARGGATAAKPAKPQASRRPVAGKGRRKPT